MKRLLLSLILVGCLHSQVIHNITLNWADTQNPGGTLYNVYRAPTTCSSTAVFTKLTTTPISTLNYTDGTVVAFTSYCYYVTATNGTVESVPSNQAGATALPFSPVSLTLKAN